MFNQFFILIKLLSVFSMFKPYVEDHKKTKRNPEKDKIRIKDDPDKKKQTRIKLAGNKSQETSFQRSPIA